MSKKSEKKIAKEEERLSISKNKKPTTGEVICFLGRHSKRIHNQPTGPLKNLFATTVNQLLLQIRTDTGYDAAEGIYPPEKTNLSPLATEIFNLLIAVKDEFLKHEKKLRREQRQQAS